MTLRVLHVCEDLRAEAGGIASVLNQLDKELRATGSSSHLVTYEGAVDPGTDALEILRVGRWRSHVPLLEEVFSSEEMEGPCVLHSHGLWGSLNHAAVSLARKRNWPVMVSLHGMLLPWAVSQKKWRKRIGWRIFQAQDLRAAARIHITSDYEADCLRNAGIECETAMIPFGVEVPQWDDMTLKSTPPFRVVFLGRLAPIKNLSGLISAWADADLGSEWQLQIAGPDEFGMCEALRLQACAEGVGESVQFLDPVFGYKKWRFIRGAAALVLPSHSENFGAVVLEALACGVPVIASTGTRWSELASEGCGWMAGTDRRDLSKTLRAMAALSCDERVDMGVRGALYADKTYSWTAVGAQFSELYRIILSEQGS